MSYKRHHITYEINQGLILKELQKGDMRFTDLWNNLENKMSQPTLTKHLKILLEKKLIKVNLIDGKSIVYSLSSSKDEK